MEASTTQRHLEAHQGRRIIHTGQLHWSGFTPRERLLVYNGIDGGVTFEVFEKLIDHLDDVTGPTYQLSLDLVRGPGKAMMERGIRVHEVLRQHERKQLDARMAEAERRVDIEAGKVWGKGLNPRSFKQKVELFYEHMQLPQQYKDDKVTTDKEAMDTLRPYAPELFDAILECSAFKDMKRVLHSGVDRDGRMRYSYSVAMAETARWKCSKSCWGTGTNMQNIPKSLRNIFIADPGYTLIECDLDRADSLSVAYMSGDANYIKAHEAEDLHSTVAALVFDLDPEQVKADDEADVAFLSGKTARHIGKGCQHALNYFPGQRGPCKAMLMHRFALQYDQAARFVDVSFEKFPRVRAWQDEIQRQLRETRQLTSPFGRRRTFYGRPGDPHTWREAVAHMGQTCTADTINHGLMNLWRGLDDGQNFMLLHQVHDSILAQCKTELLDEYVPAMLEHMRVPVQCRGRILDIPASAKVGHDWGNLHAKSY